MECECIVSPVAWLIPLKLAGAGGSVAVRDSGCADAIGLVAYGLIALASALLAGWLYRCP
jgi:hypothetical protein